MGALERRGALEGIRLGKRVGSVVSGVGSNEGSCVGTIGVFVWSKLGSCVGRLVGLKDGFDIG